MSALLNAHLQKLLRFLQFGLGLFARTDVANNSDCRPGLAFLVTNWGGSYVYPDERSILANISLLDVIRITLFDQVPEQSMCLLLVLFIGKIDDAPSD